MRARTATALLVTAAAWLAFQGPATAAPGQLSYDRCFANDDGVAGCTALAGAPIAGASGVAVSPDGGSVYVASGGSNSIAHFARSGPAGELDFDTCLANDGPAVGCLDLPFDSLGSARGVAVSPDGKSVYVASAYSDSLAHFFVTGADGQLAYDGCLGSAGAYGCGDLSGLPLEEAGGVTVSPDGKSVYVASGGSNSVAHFFRSGPQGQVVYDGCLGSTALQGCGDLDGTPLNGAYGAAVSPDGKSVYVASASSNSISHFLRSGPEGQIAYDRCIASPSLLGCTELPLARLGGARGVAVSPDGTSVYVTAPGADAIVHFKRREVDGTLVFAGCQSASPSAFGECTDLPGAPTIGATGIAISPDGRSVYVTGFAGESVAQFSRDPGEGELTYEGCLAGSNDLGQGCTDLPGRPLRGAQSVAVSPDGSSVYVASSISNSVAHFYRALDDAAPAPAAPAPATGESPTPASGLPPRCGGNDVVCGGAGRDWLSGGRGRDRLAGGPQRDTCIGGAARDRARTCEIRKSL